MFGKRWSVQQRVVRKPRCGGGALAQYADDLRTNVPAMHTIPSTNGPKHYDALVKPDGTGGLSLTIHLKGEERALLYLAGEPNWQRLVESDEFVPLSIVRRKINNGSRGP